MSVPLCALCSVWRVNVLSEFTVKLKTRPAFKHKSTSWMDPQPHNRPVGRYFAKLDQFSVAPVDEWDETKVKSLHVRSQVCFQFANESRGSKKKKKTYWKEQSCAFISNLFQTAVGWMRLAFLVRHTYLSVSFLFIGKTGTEAHTCCILTHTGIRKSQILFSVRNSWLSKSKYTRRREWCAHNAGQSQTEDFSPAWPDWTITK